MGEIGNFALFPQFSGENFDPNTILYHTSLIFSVQVENAWDYMSGTALDKD